MPTEIPPAKTQRLLSLDVLRGMAVAAMVLVNNPGDWNHIYPILEHSPWNGCTPTDLIFPFFLFMVGVSLVFSLESKKADSSLHGKIILTILRRTFILYLLGFILAIVPRFNFGHVRIMGVLQRISLVYLMTSILYLKTSPKAQLWILAFLLIGYNLAMSLIPVPGFGPANMGPETNLGAWIDRLIITPQHLWVQAKTWDPEGLFSTLPAIGTGLLGAQAGRWLKSQNLDPATKLVWLFIAGFLAYLGGMIWGLWFPINKSLWTSSFVLYTGGLATMTLSTLYWIIDIQGFNRFTKPFLVFGVNAIVVFFLSGLSAKLLGFYHIHLNDPKSPNIRLYLYKLLFEPYFSPINASLVAAISLVLFWMAILWIMYNRKIWIKI
jgi:predicted acyltransferase